MSEQSVPERDPDRRTDDVIAENVGAENVRAENVGAENVESGEDPGNYTGQVLGQSVQIPPAAAMAEPATPETGAVRDEEGRPTTEKPNT